MLEDNVIKRFKIDVDKLRTLYDLKTLINALDLTIDKSNPAFDKLEPYLKEEQR